MAHRLSENPASRVLEVGAKDLSPWLHIPVGYFKTMHDPALDWCYLTESDPGIADRRLQWSGGKVLGGSNALNRPSVSPHNQFFVWVDQGLCRSFLVFDRFCSFASRKSSYPQYNLDFVLYQFCSVESRDPGPLRELKKIMRSVFQVPRYQSR